MDFELTADQVDLQEGMRAFLDGRFPLDAVRAIEAAGTLDRGRWRELGETGVFSLRLPEADGGLGFGDLRKRRSCSRSSGARSCPARSWRRSSPRPG